jgi:hypothetical protein
MLLGGCRGARKKIRYVTNFKFVEEILCKFLALLVIGPAVPKILDLVGTAASVDRILLNKLYSISSNPLSPVVTILTIWFNNQ